MRSNEKKIIKKHNYALFNENFNLVWFKVVTFKECYNMSYHNLIFVAFNFTKALVSSNSFSGTVCEHKLFYATPTQCVPFNINYKPTKIIFFHTILSVLNIIKKIINISF